MKSFAANRGEDVVAGSETGRQIAGVDWWVETMKPGSEATRPLNRPIVGIASVGYLVGVATPLPRS